MARAVSMDAPRRRMIYLLIAGQSDFLPGHYVTTENDSGNDFRPDAQRLQRR